VVPVRNTVCETELHRLAPPGVTINTARAVRSGPTAWSDPAGQAAMAAGNREAEPAAVEELLALRPDAVIIGEGGFSFTPEEHAAALSSYREIAGVPVVMAPEAYLAALEELRVRRVAVLTLRTPERPAEVSAGFWTASGYEVTAGYGIGATTAFEIVNTSAARIRQGVRSLAATRPDAILATMSNLPLAGLVAELEAEVGLPILHVNTVLLWRALRLLGIGDSIAGAGRLISSPRQGASPDLQAQ
jgi:maleate isomerase